MHVVFPLKISLANQDSSSVLNNAKMINEMSKEAKRLAEDNLNKTYLLIERHEKFLNPTGVKSTDVAMKVDEVILLFKHVFILKFVYKKK